MPFTDDDLIFSYSRAQAIADGLLVDVSNDARAAGFLIPVAMTNTVWSLLSHIPDGSGDSLTRRLRQTLLVLRRGISYASNVSEVDFHTLKFDVTMAFDGNPPAETRQLKAICGPGDDGEPVVTIMLPNED